MSLLARLLLMSTLMAQSMSVGAAFHLMSIREVYVGPSATPNVQYIQLQMYASGQNSVSGHPVVVYNAAGIAVATYTFTANVANGANQAYILIATTDAEATFGVKADLLMAPVIDPAGGKVCFEDIDCFSWGNYAGDSVNPSPSGNPFRPMGGLAPDSATRRDSSGGSNTNALDAGDDTDDSAADFFVAAAPNPQNNSGAGAGTGGGGGGAGTGGGGGTGDGGGGGGGGSLGLLSLLTLLLFGLRRSTNGGS